MIKVCLVCGVEKPLAEFPSGYEKSLGRTVYKARCKICHQEKRRDESKSKRNQKALAENNSQDVKTCTDCCEVKPLSEFHSRGGTNAHLFRGYCRSCAFAKHRAWTEKNPEKVKEYRAKDSWTLAKRCERRGITPEQLVDRYERQEGCCAICKAEVALMESAIDHNHATGEFRGVLCKQCNRALGMFGDSLSTMKNAVEYLEAFGSYGDGT